VKSDGLNRREFVRLMGGSAAGKGARRPKTPLPAALLYDLVKDPKETTDLAAREPERVKQMTATLKTWQASVRNSPAKKDYGK
jgi:hypothetical protein